MSEPKMIFSEGYRRSLALGLGSLVSYWVRLFFQACDWLEALSSVTGSGISELVQGKPSKLKHGGERKIGNWGGGQSFHPNWHEHSTLT